MHITLKSTRHTAVGTLRRGVIYSIDGENPKQVAVAKNLLSGSDPVAKKVSAKQAEKAGAFVLTQKPTDDKTAADLRSKLAEMKAERDEALGKADKAEKDAEKAKADKAKAEAERDQAKADLDAAAAATTAAKG